MSPLLAILGSWCEGETRTGRPLPGVARTYWHQWLSRCGKDLERIAAGECPAWGLPLTVADDERVEHVCSFAPPPAREGLVAVFSPDADAAEAISEAERTQRRAAGDRLQQGRAPAQETASGAGWPCAGNGGSRLGAEKVLRVGLRSSREKTRPWRSAAAVGKLGKPWPPIGGACVAIHQSAQPAAVTMDRPDAYYYPW